MKKFFALALTLVMVLSLTACGGKEETPTEAPAETPVETPTEAPAETKEGLNILYLVNSMGEYFTNHMEIWEPYCNDLGWTIELMSAEGDAQKQVSMLETALSSGKYDAALLYPCIPESLIDVVERCGEGGMPIIAYGQSPGNGSGNFYYAIDNAQIGQYIGEMVVEWVDANPDLFPAGEKIKYMAYDLSSSPEQTKRTGGACAVLDADGRFECVARQDALLVEEAYSLAETVLTANPDTYICVGFSDDQCLGFVEVVKSKGLDPAHYGAFATDGTTGAFTSIANGDAFRGTVFYPFVLQNEDLQFIFEEAVAGTLKQEDVPTVQITKVTAENIDEWFTPAK